jgi:hypothetical protein
MADENELEEAVTIKSTVQHFLAAAHKLLGEKTLPKTIKEQIENLRLSMRKTWKDLEADIEPESTAEPAAAATEAAVEETMVESEFIPLVEKSVRTDGTIPIKIIAPGWGSSGFYGPEMLERDGPKVFTQKTKMYWNHPTAKEEAERPERDLRDLAAELVSDAIWQPNGVAGPGLYADAKMFSPFKERINELAPHIGVSIRALGRARPGTVDGKTGPIVENIAGARSIDFVTVPGAGGQILQLFESARGAVQLQPVVQEVQVNEEQAKALEAENAELKQTLARLNEAAILREARDFVALTLPVNLPELTRQRLTESLSAKPSLKDGVLDKDAYKTVIEAAATAELKYLAEATGSGRITGMGGNGSGDPNKTKADLKAALILSGLTEAQADLAVKGR